MIDLSGSGRVFSDSASLYDLLYEEKDTSGEIGWILSRLKARGLPDSGKILEIGAGTGRHARGFADVGYTVTAIDPSEEMLKRAAPHDRVSFLRADGVNLRLDQKFDAVLALFHVVSYQATPAMVSSFFHTASEHLNDGGLFGFDIWYSPAVMSLQPEDRVLTKEVDELRVTRLAKPVEDVPHSRVDVKYTYTVEEVTSGTARTFEEVHAMRHFTSTEIQLIAEAHGLSVVDSCEFMSERAPSRETWGVWFTLQKS